MVAVALSLFIVFLLLILAEWLWRTKRLRGEPGRKFVHITVGSFVAFWPFFMSFKTIQIISIAFLAVVLLSKKLGLFKAIHTVDRQTWGDILFAVGIGLVAVLTSSKWVFMAAILHLGLADGLAAVIGKRFGKTNNYKIMGHTKSLAGSAVFWVVSTAIIVTTLYLGNSVAYVILPLSIWLPISATVAEGLGMYGWDNILIPLLIVVILNPLQLAH